MKGGLRQVLLGAALVATAAVAQGTSGMGREQQQGEQQGMGGAGPQRGQAQGAMSPQELLTQFQRDNDRELQRSQLAAQRASSPQVRQLAQTMVRDHQQANQRLQQLAAQANINLPSTQTGVGGGGQAGTGQQGTSPQGATQPMSQPGMAQPGMGHGGAGQRMGQMPQQAQAEMQLFQSSQQLLSGLQGPAFDRAFLASTLLTHDLQLEELQQAQQQRGSPAATYAQQTAPTVRSHRDQAYSLLGQLAPGAAARGGTPRR